MPLVIAKLNRAVHTTNGARHRAADLSDAATHHGSPPAEMNFSVLFDKVYVDTESAALTPRPINRSESRRAPRGAAHSE